LLVASAVAVSPTGYSAAGTSLSGPVEVLTPPAIIAAIAPDTSQWSTRPRRG